MRLVNIKLDVAIRDITGKSGLAIVEAILAEHRGTQYLASLIDIRVKKTQQEITDSLNGTWREELLFELKTSSDFFKIYEKAILDCDKTIERVLIKYVPSLVLTATPEKLLKANRKKHSKHSPEFDISRIAFQYFGTDLFAISGMSRSSILCLLTNMGNDLYKFPSAKSFAAWLRLVPNNKVSGGKVISSRTPSGKNKIAKVLRQATDSIGNRKTINQLLF